MGDEADYLYNAEIDYMVELDMRAERLSNTPSYKMEIREVDDELDMFDKVHRVINTVGGRLDVYFTTKAAIDDTRNVYVDYTQFLYNPVIMVQVVSQLNKLGFKVPTGVKGCIYNINLHNYQHDKERILNELLKTFSVEKLRVTLSKKGTQCVVQFHGIPEIKYKKRLRDFGFGYREMQKIWVASRKDGNFTDVITYFNKQDKVELQIKM